MNELWIDLSTIVVYDDITLYQLLGFMTVSLAVLNVILYSIASWMFWRTTHHITQSLKNKFIMDSLMTSTTLLMGFGALLETDLWFWQLAYVCRVGLMLMVPIILWRVIVACKEIVKASKRVK